MLAVASGCPTGAAKALPQYSSTDSQSCLLMSAVPAPCCTPRTDPRGAYRVQPHNIEAETGDPRRDPRQQRGLLPRFGFSLCRSHFFEPVHQRIYDIARQPDPRQQDRHAGHAQDLPDRIDLGGLTVAQYLARLQPRRPRSSTRSIMAARSTRWASAQSDRHRRGDGQPGL